MSLWVPKISGLAMLLLHIFWTLLLPNALAATPKPLSEVALESGWDVVASRLKEEVAAAKNSKTIEKRLKAIGFHDLEMPVSFFAGSALVFETASPLQSCVWDGSVQCTFQTTGKTEVRDKAYQAVCKTKYTIAPVLTTEMHPAQNGQITWSVSNIEACWALNGQQIVLAPVGETGLEGIGKGDDFLPPELVELSWREAEEIIRSKVPIFRFCQQKLPTGHPDKSGRMVVKYHISEQGRIDTAEIERSTFEDPVLTDCVLERFRRIQIRPPMGGWTGGTFTLSFAK